MRSVEIFNENKFKNLPASNLIVPTTPNIVETLVGVLHEESPVESEEVAISLISSIIKCC